MLVKRFFRIYRNYLRVRGEYYTSEMIAHKAKGTTSACAENTQQLRITDRVKRNYLRVRGEYIITYNP